MSVTNDSNTTTTSSSTSNACIVCYRNVEYYSIGMCEHPVCYECSTRMRVLCQQNECPICRQDLPKVVFTKEIKPFRFLKKGNLLDIRYNIYFESPEIQEKFIMLLAHTCTVCEDDQVFSSFNSLKEHMRRKHDLHYCDLCVDNLKIFSHERRCYTKMELSRHRRKGDVDDKSHKGHPLCEFCEQRYMDNDELYRHLRRDHLFCHFCDADGLHQYYSSYDYLREHFRQEHYLCEEGGCADEQFTSVFRTDIDLKAHKSSVHGKQLGKAAAKQARTLELEFTLAPRGDLRNRRGPPGPMRNSRDYVGHDGNANYPRQHFNPHQQHYNHHQQQQPERPQSPVEPTFVRQPLVDVQSTEEFPTLGNSAPCLVPNLSQGKNRGGNLTIRGTLRQGNYDENFPALGPESATASSTIGNSLGGGSVSKTLNFSVSSSNKSTASATGRQQSSTPNLSIHVNHRPNGTVTTRLTGPNLRIKPGSSRDSDFPALGRAGIEPTSSSSNQSWTKITCVKAADMPRAKKVAPPPLAPSPPTIRSGADFPSLAKPSKSGRGGSSSQSQPVATNWVQVHSTDTSYASTITTDATKGKAKKKKMKQQQMSTASNGNTSSNESSSSAKASKESSDSGKKSGASKSAEQVAKSKDAEPSKKDRSKAKQNSEQNGSRGNVESSSFIGAEAAGTASAITPVTAQRKRSELKIDSLNTTNNNLSLEAKTATCKPEDFPALGRSSSRPPGLTSPPPGFGAPATTATAPPPGFLSRLNGLTFTSSSGESYSIVPDEADHGQQQRCYTYLPPANFQRRNQNLIAEFNDCFGSGESEELKAFRYLSGLFRTGVCDAEEYYKQCRTVMGAETFKRVFPELLALLPDIDKQRELFEVHKRETNVGSGRIKGLEACANCGQILRSSDIQAHATSHTLENHFPALGKVSPASGGAWSKK